MIRPSLLAPLRAAVAAAVVFALAVPAMAQVPATITQQGILEDANGVPLSGSYDLTFGLFSTATGGTAAWTETHAGVNVDRGAYAVELGSVASFASQSVDFSTPYWLEMSVAASGGGAAETLAPRTELTSVPYALSALQVEAAPSVAASVSSKASAAGPGTQLSSAPVLLDSVTVDVPEDGYLIVSLNWILGVQNGGPGWMIYGMYLDDVLVGDEYRTYGPQNGWNNASQTHAIPVSAGRQVLSVRGYNRPGSSIVVSFDRTMTAMYVPGALGRTD